MNTENDFNTYIQATLNSVAGVGNWEWNDSNVEIVLKDKESNSEAVFQQILSFFDSWDVDLLKDATLRKLVDTFPTNSYEENIATILSLTRGEWINVIGKNGGKIYDSLENKRIREMTLPIFLGSLKYMGGGFGVRKAKILLDQLQNQEDVWMLTVDDIMKLDGFSVETSQRIYEGLKLAKKFLNTLLSEGIIVIHTPQKSNALNTMVVVFTGFRDTELQNKLELAGAKVSSSVSKNTTHVVCIDPNSNSGKVTKARELGIPVIGLVEFELLIGK